MFSNVQTIHALSVIILLNRVSANAQMGLMETLKIMIVLQRVLTATSQIFHLIYVSQLAPQLISSFYISIVSTLLVFQPVLNTLMQITQHCHA